MAGESVTDDSLDGNRGPFEAIDLETGEVVTLDAAPSATHEAADVFPLMDEKALVDLAADIARNGLLHPISLFNGKVLDGRNRLKACERANVPPRFTIVSGNPWRHVWSANGSRRDLTEVVKVLCWTACEEGAAVWDAAKSEVRSTANEARSAIAKERPREADGTLASSRATMDGTTGRSQPTRSSTRVAGAIGVGRAAVEKAARILNFEGGSMVDAVRTGAAKVTEALRQIKKAEVRAKVAALPPNKYRVIYADPPWQYNDARQTGDHRESTGALHHFSTMTIAELKALDVKSLAADDSVFLCWATFPLLPEALALVSAWGFTYKTAFVWDKGHGAFGSYHDAEAELLLVTTRGSCTPDVDTKEKQIQRFPRGRHSAKPEEWRYLIDRLWTHGPRIELFQRGERPDGWDVWGAEAEEADAA